LIFAYAYAISRRVANAPEPLYHYASRKKSLTFKTLPKRIEGTRLPLLRQGARKQGMAEPGLDSSAGLASTTDLCASCPDDSHLLADSLSPVYYSPAEGRSLASEHTWWWAAIAFHTCLSAAHCSKGFGTFVDGQYDRRRSMRKERMMSLVCAAARDVAYDSPDHLVPGERGGTDQPVERSRELWLL